MGIDIYAKWDGMTKAEEKKQYTGFSTTSGAVGYLREAYHDGPYATMILLPEAFLKKNGGKYVAIPASKLQSRLPRVITTVIKRTHLVYNEKIDKSHPVVKSFIDFVVLIATKEKLGLHPKIYASY